MTIQAKITKWIRPQIRAKSAYHVPDPGECIKLDAMENPYQWPESLVQDWLDVLRGVSLNRYPDPDANALKRRLRTAEKVPDGLDILLGNGSDELIQMIALSVADKGRTVLAPAPTFVMYQLIAELVNMNYVGVPLRPEGFDLDLPAMLEAMKTHSPAVVFLAYPNNPTGNLFSENDVRKIIEAADGLVVVDEAYATFNDKTFLDEPGNYDNLLILRTVSKAGLAGLRLGYLVGLPDWLKEINKTRLPYNINVLTQVSVDFAMDHRQLLEEQARQIRRDRATLFGELNKLSGIHPYSSDANFILFQVPGGCAEGLFEELRKRGVLVKNMDSAGGLLRDCLRVTVGTPEENSTFLAALQASF